jgi:hypothetical protein
MSIEAVAGELAAQRFEAVGCVCEREHDGQFLVRREAVDRLVVGDPELDRKGGRGVVGTSDGAKLVNDPPGVAVRDSETRDLGHPSYVTNDADRRKPASSLEITLAQQFAPEFGEPVGWVPRGVQPTPSETGNLGALGRVMGVVAIAVGALAIGFNPNRWDVVILTLPRGHGIHLRDVVGTMLVALGTAVLWRLSRYR